MFVATTASAPEEVGFGRCIAPASLWATCGVAWWGQAVLVRVKIGSEPEAHGAVLGVEGGSGAPRVGTPEDGGEADENVNVDSPAHATTTTATLDVWCTAWPASTAGSTAAASPTIDCSVVANVGNLPHQTLTAMLPSGGDASKSRLVTCTVLRWGLGDPVPLDRLVLRHSTSGAGRCTADDARRALRGKSIGIGCTFAIGSCGFATRGDGVVAPTASFTDARVWVVATLSEPALSSSTEGNDGAAALTGQVTERTHIVFVAPETGSIASPTCGAYTTAARILPPGLEGPCRELEALVSLPLLHASIFAELSVDCPKGVLLYGAPGTGKTLLARTVAEQTGAVFISVDGPEIFAPYLGESEENLRRVFETAQARAAEMAVVLFIDEIDALCPRRTVEQSHESRVVAQLLTLMDGMQSRGRLVVMAATNRPNALDPALRRPGRFDREIEIKAPSSAERVAILRYCIRGLRASPDLDFDDLGQTTSGFVGADLAALCRDAVMAAVHRADMELARAPVTPLSDGGDGAPAEVAAAAAQAVPPELAVTTEDFQAAIQSFTPSTRREGHTVVRPVRWEDIGGLEEVKAKLEQAVLWPLLYPLTYKRLGVVPPRGILLHGPPGNAKTTLARALASQGHSAFYALSGAEIFSPYIGDAEKTIRDVFKKARLTAPSVIFLDEIDAVVGNRAGKSDSGGVQQRTLATLLTEMDGVASAGQVSGATALTDATLRAVRPACSGISICVQVRGLMTRAHGSWLHDGGWHYLAGAAGGSNKPTRHD
jgi:SpoVK/Ycf46/Vps4 family AAA+-type ATPase